MGFSLFIDNILYDRLEPLLHHRPIPGPDLESRGRFVSKNAHVIFGQWLDGPRTGNAQILIIGIQFQSVYILLRCSGYPRIWTVVRALVGCNFLLANTHCHSSPRRLPPRFARLRPDACTFSVFCHSATTTTTRHVLRRIQTRTNKWWCASIFHMVVRVCIEPLRNLIRQAEAIVETIPLSKPPSSSLEVQPRAHVARWETPGRPLPNK